MIFPNNIWDHLTFHYFYQAHINNMNLTNQLVNININDEEIIQTKHLKNNSQDWKMGNTAFLVNPELQFQD